MKLIADEKSAYRKVAARKSLGGEYEPSGLRTRTQLPLSSAEEKLNCASRAPCLRFKRCDGKSGIDYGSRGNCLLDTSFSYCRSPTSTVVRFIITYVARPIGYLPW